MPWVLFCYSSECTPAGGGVEDRRFAGLIQTVATQDYSSCGG